MKKAVLSIIVALFLAVSLNTYAAGQTKVEVLYMNHGPLMNTISQLKKIFASYGANISVSWYDFESQEGEQFMTKKGIKQHIPLVIWIDGKTKWMVGNKEVSFVGFPSGSGPIFFQGKWTMDDLKGAFDQVTAKK